LHAHLIFALWYNVNVVTGFLGAMREKILIAGGALDAVYFAVSALEGPIRIFNKVPLAEVHTGNLRFQRHDDNNKKQRKVEKNGKF
jgi:hypothetical protein